MKRMMVLLVLTALGACNKSSEPSSPYEALYSHAWINSKWTVNGANQTISICDKDDTLTFGINGTTIIDRGIEKCFVGQQKFSSGTYTLQTNQLSATFDGKTTLYTLTELNDDILNMYEMRGTDTYRFIYAPKK